MFSWDNFFLSEIEVKRPGRLSAISAAVPGITMEAEKEM